MSPPIDIDGSEIQKATIDGQNVNQVTIDGQQVFVGVGILDNIVGQYDATDLALSDGDSVDTWPDIVGDVGDLIADSSRTPTYSANGMNGNPVVEMSEDFFTLTTNTEISMPWYMFNVYNNDDANSERFQFLGNDAGNTMELVEGESGVWFADDGTNSISGGSTDSNNHIVVFGIDGSNSFIRVDGTEVASGTVSNSVNGSYDVGNNTFFRHADGSWAQIEWFEGNLTASEISGEEQRLADKWGITL